MLGIQLNKFSVQRGTINTPKTFSFTKKVIKVRYAFRGIQHLVFLYARSNEHLENTKNNHENTENVNLSLFIVKETGISPVTLILKYTYHAYLVQNILHI